MQKGVRALGGSGFEAGLILPLPGELGQMSNLHSRDLIAVFIWKLLVENMLAPRTDAEGMCLLHCVVYH